MKDGREVAANGFEITARLIEFARFARANGLRMGIAEDLDAARVAVSRGVASREALYWALRSLFCRTREDWERFPALFDAFWNCKEPHTTTVIVEGSSARGGGTHERPAGAVSWDEDRSLAGAHGRDGRRSGASSRRGLARQDFRELVKVDQMRPLTALVERLATRMRKRIMRRLKAAPKGRLNFRATIRNSLPYGGLPLKLALRRRVKRPPKLLLLLDVSGSMSLYSMLFLRFARVIARVFSEVEVFVFHTQLVRTTEALRERNAERMKERIELISLGWAGGTRIGHSLRQLNDRFGRHVVARRPFVVIISDGLDTGPAADLALELNRLKRRAGRLVWLNPLFGRPGYEPTAAGMAAALPYLDAFLPAHDLASLEALEPYLAGL